MGIKINNYANWITASFDDSVSVKANIIGYSIFIPYQVVLVMKYLKQMAISGGFNFFSNILFNPKFW